MSIERLRKDVRRSAPTARLAWVRPAAHSAALLMQQTRLGWAHLSSWQCTQATGPRHRRTVLMAMPWSPHAFSACCQHAALPRCHSVAATTMPIQHIYHAYVSPVSSLCSGSVGDTLGEEWFACCH